MCSCVFWTPWINWQNGNCIWKLAFFFPIFFMYQRSMLLLLLLPQVALHQVLPRSPPPVPLQQTSRRFRIDWYRIEWDEAKLNLFSSSLSWRTTDQFPQRNKLLVTQRHEIDRERERDFLRSERCVLVQLNIIYDGHAMVQKRMGGGGERVAGQECTLLLICCNLQLACGCSTVLAVRAAQHIPTADWLPEESASQLPKMRRRFLLNFPARM